MNRQCQECGGYELDDGTSELCYCSEEEDEMSEKVSEYWLIEGATRIIACKVDPREIPGNESCVVLAHTIDKQDYDRLAEINKVLSEAFVRVESIAKPTLKTYRSDGGKLEAILFEVRDSLAKVKEMGK